MAVLQWSLCYSECIRAHSSHTFPCIWEKLRYFFYSQYNQRIICCCLFFFAALFLLAPLCLLSAFSYKIHFGHKWNRNMVYVPPLCTASTLYKPFPTTFNSIYKHRVYNTQSLGQPTTFRLNGMVPLFPLPSPPPPDFCWILFFFCTVSPHVLRIFGCAIRSVKMWKHKRKSFGNLQITNCVYTRTHRHKHKHTHTAVRIRIVLMLSSVEMAAAAVLLA